MKTWHSIKDVTYCVAEKFDQMKSRNNHYFNCGDTIVLANLLLSKEVQCYCLQLVMAKLFVNSHVSRFTNLLKFENQLLPTESNFLNPVCGIVFSQTWFLWNKYDQRLSTTVVGTTQRGLILNNELMNALFHTTQQLMILSTTDIISDNLIYLLTSVGL